MGHLVVFSLFAARGLPKWWLYPVAVILQMGTLPHPILDFTWSSLNKVTARKASEKVMNFRGTLHRITRQVLTADPWLVLVYLGKVDLSKAYMRIWVRIEDTSSVDFLLPKKMTQEKQLVGFHSSLPLGFVDSM